MPNKRQPDTGGYAVGFGQPPADHRFQPGVSGNPKGRPKGSRNVGTVLERALRELVVINEGGRRKTISKLEAAVKQVTNKAASGDLAAAKLLLCLVHSAEEDVAKNKPAEANLGEADQKVLQGMLKRLETSTKGGTDRCK